MNNFEVCFLTKNDCYGDGRFIKPTGIMVHSTGANNPRVNRYVPIGKNYSAMNWNKPGIKKCVHGFLGIMPNGEIGFAQTLPWNKRGWHAGGDANNTHIGFEICEDGLLNESYFKECYNYAVELCAMLCKEYNIDPIKKGALICHSEGYKLGIASGHADVMHWWPKFGKTMDNFRADVVQYMKGETKEMTQEEFNKMIEKYLEEHKETVERNYNALMQNWIINQCGYDWSKYAIKEQIPEFVTRSGISDGTSPKLYATREQVWAFIMRAFKAYGIDILEKKINEMK